MITIITVEPIGTRTSPAFVKRANGCQLEDFTSNVYPPEARRDGRVLWVHRVETCDLSLREAATAAGLSAEQVSGLEHGRYTFATAVDHADYVVALEGAKEAKHAG